MSQLKLVIRLKINSIASTRDHRPSSPFSWMNSSMMLFKRRSDDAVRLLIPIPFLFLVVMICQAEKISLPDRLGAAQSHEGAVWDEGRTAPRTAQRQGQGRGAEGHLHGPAQFGNIRKFCSSSFLLNISLSVDNDAKLHSSYPSSWKVSKWTKWMRCSSNSTLNTSGCWTSLCTLYLFT